jgi:hypothetical protein
MTVVAAVPSLAALPRGACDLAMDDEEIEWWRNGGRNKMEKYQFNYHP